MSYRPLFVTGIARSGTSLLARMLSAHSDVEIAVDAFLPIYRGARDAIAAYAGLELRGGALEDTYFCDYALELLDRVEESQLDCPLDSVAWPSIRSQLLARASHHASDLCPSLSCLDATQNFRDLFINLLRIVAKVRAGETKRWIGAKDVWTIDYMVPLARSFPDACFIVIIRDPRACVASNDAVRDTDQFGHNISYARHWRKNVVRALHYQNHPLFSGRFMLIQYEDLVRDPKATAIQLTHLLGLDFDPQMLDMTHYFDHTKQRKWQGNSSFGDISHIDDAPIHRWQNTLDARIVQTVEFLCGPEMRIMGYDVELPILTEAIAPQVVKYFIDSSNDEVSWRSDTGDPMQDLGYELFRYALLGNSTAYNNQSLIRRCFLSDVAYQTIRTALHLDKAET